MADLQTGHRILALRDGADSMNVSPDRFDDEPWSSYPQSAGEVENKASPWKRFTETGRTFQFKAWLYDKLGDIMKVNMFHATLGEDTIMQKISDGKLSELMLYGLGSTPASALTELGSSFRHSFPTDFNPMLGAEYFNESLYIGIEFLLWYEGKYGRPFDLFPYRGGKGSRQPKRFLDYITNNNMVVELRRNSAFNEQFRIIDWDNFKWSDYYEVFIKPIFMDFLSDGGPNSFHLHPEGAEVLWNLFRKSGKAGVYLFPSFTTHDVELNDFSGRLNAFAAGRDLGIFNEIIPEASLPSGIRGAPFICEFPKWTLTAYGRKNRSNIKYDLINRWVEGIYNLKGTRRGRGLNKFASSTRGKVAKFLITNNALPNLWGRFERIISASSGKFSFQNPGTTPQRIVFKSVKISPEKIIKDFTGDNEGSYSDYSILDEYFDKSEGIPITSDWLNNHTIEMMEPRMGDDLVGIFNDLVGKGKSDYKELELPNGVWISNPDAFGDPKEVILTRDGFILDDFGNVTSRIEFKQDLAASFSYGHGDTDLLQLAMAKEDHRLFICGKKINAKDTTDGVEEFQVRIVNITGQLETVALQNRMTYILKGLRDKITKGITVGDAFQKLIESGKLSKDYIPIIEHFIKELPNLGITVDDSLGSASEIWRKTVKSIMNDRPIFKSP